MKRILVIATACLALAACHKDEICLKNENSLSKTAFVKGQEVTLSANMGSGNETKVIQELDDETGVLKSKWEEDDSILVTVNGSSAVFHLVSGAGEYSGTFKGVMPESGEVFDVQYPVNTPNLAHQIYREKALPEDMMLDTAKNCTLDSGFTLKHQYAVLRVNLYGGGPVENIFIESSDTGFMFSDTLICPNVQCGSTREQATPFFIVLPAGSYRFHCYFPIKELIGMPAEPTYNKQTLTAGKVLNMPVFNISCVQEETLYSGSFYTYEYPHPFKTILGKTDEEIRTKMDGLWNHFFVDNSTKIYVENGNEAYILDTEAGPPYCISSEGISWGMMICMQTSHKNQFDKLLTFAKNHMYHTSGNWDGYLSGKISAADYTVLEEPCCPGAEMYFNMALMFANHRWGDAEYMKIAQYNLEKMWQKSTSALFNDQHNVIIYQPVNCTDFSNPSYDLPSFAHLFSHWSETNTFKWQVSSQATRDHMYKSCNTSSGLFSDLNNFDGTPHSVSWSSTATRYYRDAVLCALNYGMDYYLFGIDGKRQTELAKRIIDFFEKDSYSHRVFNWDGSGASDNYSIGQVGANAVACYALMKESGYSSKVKTNLEKAWNATLPTGNARYYDGLIYYMSMLHLTGKFRIWRIDQ